MYSVFYMRLINSISYVDISFFQKKTYSFDRFNIQLTVSNNNIELSSVVLFLLVFIQYQLYFFLKKKYCVLGILLPLITEETLLIADLLDIYNTLLPITFRIALFVLS